YFCFLSIFPPPPPPPCSTLFPYTTLFRSTPQNGLSPVYFGLDASCPYHAEQITSRGLKGTDAHFVTPSSSFDAHISIPGSHMVRSEEHTSELQSRFDLVCRLLLEKKKQNR